MFVPKKETQLQPASAKVLSPLKFGRTARATQDFRYPERGHKEKKKSIIYKPRGNDEFSLERLVSSRQNADDLIAAQSSNRSHANVFY